MRDSASDVSPIGFTTGTADSEEKQEPASDTDTALMDSLKVLDPEWPIREADSCTAAYGGSIRSPRRRGPAAWAELRGPSPLRS
jgi:hypothetical protein